MIKILCNRIRLTDLKTTIFLTLTPKRRVIIELLNNTTISEKEVKSNLTLKDLSEMSVVSIRLVKKNMNELEKLGLIKIQEDDSIVIINRKGLEKLEQTT
jgi:predicted transcriptional regulator